MLAKDWEAYRARILAHYPFGDIRYSYDEHGRLHNSSGPAVISPVKIQYYIDGRPHGPCADIYGSETFYYKGIIIPPHWWTAMETITLQEVLAHPNVEVRAVGVEILISVGSHKLDKLMEKIETDDWGVLYSIAGLSEVLILKVVNATPEADGSFKDYFLLVPPGFITPKAAVAWTFGKNENEYNPIKQT